MTQRDVTPGHRPLSAAEFDLLVRIRTKEAEVVALYRDVMEHHHHSQQAQRQAASGRTEASEALRQAAIARTEFESAFMRLVRSVTRPDSPWVREEP